MCRILWIQDTGYRIHWIQDTLDTEYLILKAKSGQRFFRFSNLQPNRNKIFSANQGQTVAKSGRFS